MTDAPRHGDVGGDLIWLLDRLDPLVRLSRQAESAGLVEPARTFLVAGTRLVGLLWLPEVLDRSPCWTYRGELALAWRAFRKARATLEAHGIITRLEFPQRVA